MKEKKNPEHVGGRVRRNLMQDYTSLRDAGYSDTEIVNEGVRSLAHQLKCKGGATA